MENVKYEYVELLFSRQYEHRGDLFEGLNIWSDLKYRNIQGSYPVIYLSFADVKQDCYGDTVQKIRHIIGDTYRQHRYLLDALCFTEAEKHQFTKVMNCEMDDVTAQDALKNLSYYLHHYWKSAVSFCLTSMIRLCRRRMCMDIGMNLLILSAAYLILL